jgi:hypothetical protein
MTRPMHEPAPHALSHFLTGASHVPHTPLLLQAWLPVALIQGRIEREVVRNLQVGSAAAMSFAVLLYLVSFLLSGLYKVFGFRSFSARGLLNPVG